MNKKLLLSLTNGILLVSFCNMEKAIGAVSLFSWKRGSGRSRSVEPMRKVGRFLPPPPRRTRLPLALLPWGTRRVVPVICNKRVLEVYGQPNYSDSDLLPTMIKLTKAIAKALSQCDSNGAKNLVYQLAEMYKTADQDTKDAIVLYFLDFRECYADGTIDGCDDAEREAINFINECLVNEEGESLFSL